MDDYARALFQPPLPRRIFPKLITDKLVSPLGGTFIVTVICDSKDGLGCGTWWLEYDGHAREHCPGCGRRNKNGNIIINSEDTPDVTGLHDTDVLVVGNEEAV